MKILFLGGGNITEALIASLLKRKVFRANNLLVNDIRQERCVFLRRKFGVQTATNKSIVKLAEVIILAVKPQQIDVALNEIRPLLLPRQLVISVAAGITIRYLCQMLRSEINPRPKIIRTMPNTPVAVGAGLTAISFGPGVTQKQQKIAQKIFSTCGEVLLVKENQIDAITAISGSGPGYFLYFADCFQKIAEELGLGKYAELLVRQTLYGSGMMVKNLPGSFLELLRKVMSPGGTTEAAIKYWIEKKLSNMLKDAVLAAKERAGELSRR